MAPAVPDSGASDPGTSDPAGTAPVGSGSPATDFSLALLREFVCAGVTDVVVSPGSRSQALALAAAATERAGSIRVHVRLDERTAAFFALGLAVESGRPALVVTTSGTAVANLHPAVLEAHHSGVPMIVLSADRPAELRGIGSNQTTVQAGIFGSTLRLLRDVEAPTVHGVGDPAVDPDAATAVRALAREAVAAAAGHQGAPGPVQLDIGFREPLSAGAGVVVPVAEADIDRAFATRRARPVGEPDEDLAVDEVPGTVVIAGHDATDDAERIAWEIGAPLLAEVTSGAHFGRNLAVAYRQLLADPEFGGEVRRAIVLGHPTLSREVPALLKQDGVETIVVRGVAGEAYDPGRALGETHGARIVAGVRVTGRPGPAHRAWVGRWVATSRAILGGGDAAPDLHAKRSEDRTERAQFFRDEVAIQRRPVTRELLVDAVWGATWPHDRLVLGASTLIRVADQRVPGKKVVAHANRGLAGIDGTISTALGVSAAQAADDGRGGTTRVLVGDLTFLHDLGGLVSGTLEPPYRLQVIVGDDGGGAIFDGLEVAASTDPADMRRLMSTPQTVDIEPLVTALGWTYRRAATWGDLEKVLTDPAERVVIEVPLAV